MPPMWLSTLVLAVSCLSASAFGASADGDGCDPGFFLNGTNCMSCIFDAMNVASINATGTVFCQIGYMHVSNGSVASCDSSSGNGEWQNVGSCVVPNINATILKILSNTTTSVTLEFQGLPTEQQATLGLVFNISFLRISQSGVDTTNSATYITLSNSSTYRAERLTAGSTYGFNVSVCSVAGCGTPTYVRVSTEEGTPSGLVVNLTAAQTTLSSVFLNWTLPALEDRQGVILNYSVAYQRVVQAGVSSNQSNVTTMTEYVAAGLTAGTEYAFYISACTSAGCGLAQTIRANTTVSAPTGPVTNLTLVQTMSTSVKINWTLPMLDKRGGVILKYMVTYQRVLQAGVSSVSGIQSNSTTMTEYMANGLTTGSQYMLTVSACTSAGCGPIENITANTSDNAPDGLVGSLTVVQTTSSSVKINWTLPMLNKRGGVILKYMVTYQRVLQAGVSSVSSIQSNSTTMTEYMATGLTTGSQYMLAVSACTSAGCGPIENITANTSDNAPTGPVTNLTVVQTMSTSVKINWTLPMLDNRGGVILKYMVTYQRVLQAGVSSASSIQSNSTTMTEYMATGLTTGSQYMLAVSACTSTGCGPAEKITANTTDSVPNGLVGNLTVVQTMSTSVKINWTLPMLDNRGGVILKYMVTYQRVLQAGVSSVSSIQSNSTTMTEYMATGLTTGSQYMLTVSACTSAGCGPIENITANTSDNAPGGLVGNLAVVQTMSTSVKINWTLPMLDKRGGVILKYMVTYQRLLQAGVSSVSSIQSNSTTMTEYMATGLTTGSQYMLTVSACTSTGCGPAEKITANTSDNAPDGLVGNLTVVQATSTSVKINWTLPMLNNRGGVILKYMVTYQRVLQAGVSSVSSIQSNSTTMTEYMATGLTTGSQYMLTVSACTSAGCGPAQTITANTNDGTPNGTITVLAVNQTTSTSIKVIWELPELNNRQGVISNYNVTYQRLLQAGGSAVNGQIPGLTNMTGYIANGLTAGSQYIFAVSACTSVGCGVIKTITTNTSDAAPSGTVTALQVTATSNVSATLIWIIPSQERRNGEITSYKYMYSRTRQSGENQTTPPLSACTETTTIALASLSAGSVYSVSVSACTSGGCGPTSTIPVTTNDSLPYVAPAVTVGLNGSTIDVAWSLLRSNESGGVIGGFQVSYQRTLLSGEMSRTMPSVRVISLGSGVTHVLSTQIKSLDYGAQYSVRVGACTSAGCGPDSVKLVNTSEQVPSQPVMNLTATSNTTSVNMTWERPPLTSLHGALSYFRIQGWRTQQADEVSNPEHPLPVKTVQAIINEESYNTVLSSLSPGSLFRFNVSPCRLRSGTVSCGPSRAIRLGTAVAVPSGSVITVTGAIMTTEVQLTWNLPDLPFRNGIITHYQWSYQRLLQAQIADVGNSSTGNTTSTNLLVKDLSPGSTYQFSITPCNAAGCASTFYNNYTTTESKPTAAVNNLRQVIAVPAGRGTNSSWLVWLLPAVDNLGGVVTHYFCTYTRTRQAGKPSSHQNGSVRTSTTSCNLTNLTSGSVYSANVIACNSAGCSPPATLSVRTSDLVPTASVIDLSVSSSTFNSLFLVWKLPATAHLGGEIRTYTWQYQRLQMAGMAAKTGNMTTQSTALTTSFTVPALSHASKFRVSVMICNKAGCGPPVSVEGNTQALAPPTVDLPTATAPASSVKAVVPQFRPQQQLALPVPETDSSNGQILAVALLVYRFCNGVLSGANPISYRQYLGCSTCPCPPYIAKFGPLSSLSVGRGNSSYLVVGDTAVNPANGTVCNNVCNAPLDPGVQYSVSARFFTKAPTSSALLNDINAINNGLHRDHVLASATTATDPDNGNSSTGVIVAVVLTLLAVVGVAGGLYAYSRHQNPSMFASTEFGLKDLSSRISPMSRQPLASSSSLDPFGIVRKVGAKKSDKDMRRKLSSPSLTSINTDVKEYIRPVKLEEFPHFVSQMRANSDLRLAEDFETIKTVGKESSVVSATSAANKPKNRYMNILAYDDTRVHLERDEPQNQMTDYVNANYIDGYRHKKRYIAAQGPLPTTVNDFWQMVWQQDSSVIVMVTQVEEKGRIKCFPYWPQGTNDILDCYGLEVNLMVEATEEHWIRREINLVKDDNLRTVTQFAFRSWPDHGVPKSTDDLLKLVFTVRRYLRECVEIPRNPLVVHCSAGVGRTGTFIAVDTLIERLCNKDFLDPFGVVCAMRERRNLMVQTEEQYIYIYKCLLNVTEQLIQLRGDAKPTDVNRAVLMERVAESYIGKSALQNSDMQFGALISDCSVGRQSYKMGLEANTSRTQLATVDSDSMSYQSELPL